MAALSTSSSTFDQEDVTTILDGLAVIWWDGARGVECDREELKVQRSTGTSVLATSSTAPNEQNGA